MRENCRLRGWLIYNRNVFLSFGGRAVQNQGTGRCGIWPVLCPHITEGQSGSLGSFFVRALMPLGCSVFNKVLFASQVACPNQLGSPLNTERRLKTLFCFQKTTTSG